MRLAFRRSGLTLLTGLSVAVSVGSPLRAQRGTQPAQRGGPPNPDTPQLVVAVLASADRKLGVDAADEIRRRVQSEHSAKELYAIPKVSIDNTLKGSGFSTDSVLSSMDLMELAKEVHGDYVLEGTVARRATGLHADTRVLLQTGSKMVVQPLAPVDGKDIGDVARQVDRAISAAMKAMPAYRQCVNDLRAQKYDAAIADARKGLVAYPGSLPNRVCILSAYSATNAAPDSIIAIATAITAADSTNMIAWANLAAAYEQRKDAANALRASLAMYRIDPTNVAVLMAVIDHMVNAGQAMQALAILDTALVTSPSDVNLLRKRWTVQLYAHQYRQALASGVLLVKTDTAAATVEYYQRQLGAAQADSNAAAVQRLAATAAARFPKELSFQLLAARSAFNAGHSAEALAAARRAQALDTRSAAAWQIAVAVQNQLNQPDSAIATARQAIAAGVPKDTIGASLLAIAGPALAKAQTSKTRADWQAALEASETVDAVAPSPQSAFYVGVSAVQIENDVLHDVQRLVKGSPKKADQQRACAGAKQAEDLLAKTSIAMPKGGVVDKATAGQVLAAVPQLGDFVGSVKKAYCK
jgi:tetratricopeptide (TPR) repeat protein